MIALRREFGDPAVAGFAPAIDEVVAAADAHQQQRGHAALGEREVIGTEGEATLRLGVWRNDAALAGGLLRQQ